MTETPVSLPPVQSLVLEVLAARHRLGEAFWQFDRHVHHAIERLADLGLVEHDGTRTSLTEAGRARCLSPDWRPASVHAREGLADGLTDSAGTRWWIDQAHARGIDHEALLGVAEDAAEQIRAYGRVLPEDVLQLMRRDHLIP